MLSSSHIAERDADRSFIAAATEKFSHEKHLKEGAMNTKNQSKIKPARLIKLTEVKAMTTLSTSEIYRRVAAGAFPSQVILGPKSVAWVEAEVVEWIESMVDGRGNAKC